MIHPNKYIRHQVWREQYLDKLASMTIEKVIRKLPRVEVVSTNALRTSYHRKSQEFAFVKEFLENKGFSIEEVKLEDRRNHFN